MTEETKLEQKDIEEILNFQKILDGIAQTGDGSNHAKIGSKFSPTELSACIRNSYFDRMYPIPYDEDSYRNFLLGNTIHEIFQKNLDFKLRDKVLDKVLHGKIRFLESEKSYMYLLPLELTNNKRIIISGRLDTIIFLHGYDKPVVVDYKTTSDLKYSLDHAKNAHIAQVNFYLGCTLGDIGMVVYVDKKNLSVVQHTTHWSPEKFNEMIQYAITLNKHLEEKTIPTCDIPLMKKEGYCSYCKHKDRCLEEERRLVKQ